MITERILHSSKVMVWWLLLVPLSAALLCRPGHQFWDETLEKCINCSTCPKVGHIVVRPCQVHQDTQCGTFSDLDIDWSFLGRPRSSKTTSSLHHQHSSKKYTGGNRRRSEVEFSQDMKSFPNHRNRTSHPKVVTSKEVEVQSHKNYHRKFSSEESPKKHHNHHHSHRKLTASETRSSNPQKPYSHNHNKTTNHHKHHRFEWSSSDVVDTFEATESSSLSELHNEGHRWSFSETDSSYEHHTSSSKKSNSTKKLSHHSHHPHSHKKQMDNPETHKHHRKKQKLQSLQEEVDNILVNRPESASQLKEAETIINSSFNGEVKDKVRGPGMQRVLPKRLHKGASPLSVSSAPFSATEELVWDWQAVALALAVFACLLFFIVACVYTVHHARQWRRLKDNFEDFEADVGELSTRLNLLLPVVHPDERSSDSVQADCCSDSNQCVYLEQLLARKRQTEEGGEHGNVYIDRDVVTGQRT